jgi:hypothetical protein
VPRASKRQGRQADDDDEELDRPATSRPWWWRLLLRKPRDTLAFLVLSGAAGAIVVNSVYLQHGPHPAPIFAVHSLPVAAARDNVGAVQHLRRSDLAPPLRHEAVELPRPRPATAPATVPSHKDPIAELLAEHPLPHAHQTAPAPQPAPTRSLLAPSRQVLAVQRALSEYGYGQLKPTGIYDADTRAAVQRFERDRKLPVTGELSEAVKRELATLTGHGFN